MNRRAFLAGAAALLAAPLAAEAQPAGKVVRVAILWVGAAPPSLARMTWFRQGLSESGYVEGQNVAIDVRWAERPERLRELAAELVHLNVSVITTFGDLAPRLVQQTTTAIPVVAITDDFVAAGLGHSLARPGANVTGVSIFSPDLSAKRMELLKEMLPQMSRVAALWDPTSPAQFSATEQVAQSLRVKVQVLKVQGRDDLAPAFRAAKNGRAEALNVLASPLLSALQPDIMELAKRNGLPAMYQFKEQAEVGGLVSYGPSLAALWQQAAHVVGKILNGAKPADLPVEQPTKFELVINLKTAKALGLTIPPSLLARADQVIE
jgi:putative ABC transport system substrate-binding protein